MQINRLLRNPRHGMVEGQGVVRGLSFPSASARASDGDYRRFRRRHIQKPVTI